MPTALLIVGVLAAASSACAVWRVRHPSTISVFVMFSGWLGSELAPILIPVQVIVAASLVAVGGLDEPRGWIGLVGMALAVTFLGRAHQVAKGARQVLAISLESHHPSAAAATADSITPVPRNPFRYDKSGLSLLKDLEYGPEGAHRLDVYRPDDGSTGLPILLYVHGGGWVIGNKEQQALPLLHRLPGAGWVGITINYRLAPKHRLPAASDDVTQAIEWIRANPEVHGGNPDHIVICGGSAGGHLATVEALTNPAITAAVPIYGAYDFTDREGIRGYARLRPFLERVVMSTKQADDPEGWAAMSPLSLVHESAPPFFVIHGANDVLLWREETALFVDRLRAASNQPVTYAELPGTQHAFDMFHSARSTAAVDSILAFLESTVTARRPA